MPTAAAARMPVAAPTDERPTPRPRPVRARRLPGAGMAVLMVLNLIAALLGAAETVLAVAAAGAGCAMAAIGATLAASRDGR